jgi:ribose 1,5-bisphosphokinase PhnN
MTITIITGVSGSGKTTLAEELRSLARDEYVLWEDEMTRTHASGAPRYEDVVHDLDEDGTPRAGAVAWLNWRAQEEVYSASVFGLQDAYITGIVWPHDLIQSGVLDDIDPEYVRFFMLDVPHTVIKRRLQARCVDNERELTEHNRRLAVQLRRQMRYVRNGDIIRVKKQTPRQLAELIRGSC